MFILKSTLSNEHVESVFDSQEHTVCNLHDVHITNVSVNTIYMLKNFHSA